MGLAQEIQKRIRSKEMELVRWESQLREVELQISSIKAYIQGLRDILPRAEKDDAAPAITASFIGAAGPDYRQGSVLAKVKDMLEKAGKALHITDIIVGLGKENTPDTRLSVASVIARDVRRKGAFVRVAPNTFGLRTWGAVAEVATSDGVADDPDEEDIPEGFGR